MRKSLDITGLRYGRLVALERVSKTHWKCICDCGNVKDIRKQCLLYDVTKSCGCLVREKAKENQTKHGMRNERIYYIWRGMKARCFNKNNDSYKKYGEKGITVCKEWLEFKNFKDWAFLNGYSSDLTIDRIDNSKGYCPENCRWSDKTTQTRNRGITIRIKMNDGNCLFTKEFSEIKKITKSALEQRISLLKRKNIEITEDNLCKGFEKGFKKRKYQIEHLGKIYSAKEYSELMNLKISSLLSFLRRVNKDKVSSKDIKLKEKLKINTGNEVVLMSEFCKENKLNFSTMYSRARKISKERFEFNLEELGVKL